MTISQPQLARFHVNHPHKIAVDRLHGEDRMLYEALKRGDTVQTGPHRVSIETRPGRRSVHWRDIVVQLKGEDYAKEVLENTPAEAHEYLVVH